MAPVLFNNRGKIVPSDGGRGAFSYADTSIYGARQLRSNWVDLRRNPPVTSAILVVPGGGGGARAMGKLAHGSHAVGSNPNGLVVIRLTKIE